MLLEGLNIPLCAFPNIKVLIPGKLWKKTANLTTKMKYFFLARLTNGYNEPLPHCY